jgi:hypothetical protein
MDYCDSLSLAGHSDWRLPSVGRLVSLVIIAQGGPAIDIQYFPQSRSIGYSS